MQNRSINKSSIAPNIWDTVVITIVLGSIALIGLGIQQMTGPYQLGQEIPINLSAWSLPSYTLNTVLRMFIALFFSLLFTFLVAPLAAKNKYAEKFIIPFIDIMESVPVLGVLSISIVPFIQLFPNSLLGPECAAIFAIFTGQVWNMTLSLYQSLRTVPSELQDAARVFQLSGWQKFWRVEVPHAIPALLWNTMISMSAGWFFVVYSEAISVANQTITLQGLGSYIHVAIIKSDINAIFYAIAAMFTVIIIYDQLLFRPLIDWSKKFSTSESNEESDDSTVFAILAKTRILKKLNSSLAYLREIILNPPIFKFWGNIFKLESSNKRSFARINKIVDFNQIAVAFWNTFLVIGSGIAFYSLINFVSTVLTFKEISYVLFLGFITAIKISVLIFLASIFWVPIGVWVGLRPSISKYVQPIAQILAAFPANLLYPFAVILILRFGLNVDIWSSPLMILSTQWYILFNIIVGTNSIPKDILDAAEAYNVKGLIWWKKIIIPAIFPYFITGAMAAAGGAWNASIAADVLSWGDQTLNAVGLGNYIKINTDAGDFPRLALGIGIMCLYVTIINRLVWHKLYDIAEERFKAS